MSVPRSRRRSLLINGSLVAVAIAIMNVTTYGLTLAAARLLGPAQFGQFSSILGVLIVVNVVSLGLQATGARRIATSPPHQQLVIEQEIRRLTWRCAAAVAAACLLISPLLASLLRTDSLWSLVLMGIGAGFLCLMGGYSGILQGEQRWLPLALMYGTMGVARLAFGLAALLLIPSTTSVMVGVAVAAVAPALVGLVALRGSSRLQRHPAADAIPQTAVDDHRGGALAEIGHSSHALFAFFAVSNVDIVLARALLDDHQAGLYAAGLVMTKAALFLPQFVVIFLFPAMARSVHGRSTHLSGAAVIAITGACAAAAVALLPHLSLELVGGSLYAQIGPSLWLFATLGTVLAIIQLLVYGALAQRHGRAVWIVWIGLAATVVLAWRAEQAHELLLIKVAVDIALLAALIVFLLFTRPAPTLPNLSGSPILAESASSGERPAAG